VHERHAVHKVRCPCGPCMKYVVSDP
jgi:hypothetical protein